MGFVGREEELNQLRAWFADPVLRRWLLAGDGGKGKSSLAYEFAHEIRTASPRDLFGVFGVSAKKRRFDEGAVTEVSTPDFGILIPSWTHCCWPTYGQRMRVRASTLKG